jgi:two-component system, cell cycle sensor histidine kinase and response regulator CckA
MNTNEHDIIPSRPRTEDALRETEDRFRKLADATPVIMWLKNTDHHVSFINRAGAEFFGLSAEQLTNEGWMHLMHPDDLAVANAVYFSAVDRRANDQVEFRARRADGEYRHMLATTGPRFVGGTYVGQAGTLVDITDLKRRQEEDLARQKLESLGTLAGGIAHDFNNLLNAIVAQTELALTELAEGASAEVQLRTIAGVAVHGAEIVRELMVYAGQEEATLEPVNVSRLTEDTMELLKVVVSKHAALKFHLEAAVPAVRADPGAIRQLLVNLVINASEAIGDRDGVIQVSTSRVGIPLHSRAADSELPPGDYLQLEVSDTGRGIAPENTSKIFDPFFSTKAHNRGLGLAVVRRIVKRLAGTVIVRAVPGGGTTFQILLPGAGDSAADSRKSSGDIEEAQAVDRGTILLVEDEKTVRSAVARLLSKQGFTVLEAAGGSEAKEILGSRGLEITAMILDVTLPGIPSPEIFRQARSLRPDLRIVVTSAYSEQRVAAMFAGFEGQPFLLKPYRLAEILKVHS